MTRIQILEKSQHTWTLINTDVKQVGEVSASETDGFTRKAVKLF